MADVVNNTWWQPQAKFGKAAPGRPGPVWVALKRMEQRLKFSGWGRIPILKTYQRRVNVAGLSTAIYSDQRVMIPLTNIRRRMATIGLKSRLPMVGNNRRIGPRSGSVT